MALSLACSSAELGDRHGRIPASQLLAGDLFVEEQATPELVDDDAVLALSAGMRSFVEANVRPRAFPGTRVKQLIHAIIDEGTFGLEFDGVTRTASETFRTRRGNCLSFSNMFVAMARHAKLIASFQEVDLPPDWTLEDEVFVLNRHVNVHLDLGEIGDHVVDFNIDDFETSYDTRLISDTRALAHYFNNLGVERMQAGDSVSAIAYFRRAIEDAHYQFSPAWTNLGTLYRRRGFTDYAEAAYLQALRADSEDSVAMSNLANLYEQRGDDERAARYRKKVIQHRKRNPYYRYHRALEAYSSGDYNTAIRHLKHAIGKKQNEDQFYFLLGMSYLQKGNNRAARRWLARAEEVAASDALKRKYSTKLDALRLASERSPQ